jgi:hypothetical protein
MTTTAGLWIDHRKAVIVNVTAGAEETLEIPSNVEKQAGRFAGIRSTTPYESKLVKADDTRQRKFTGDLNQYYDEVVAAIREIDAIFIFGPGEAKGQLKKRLEYAKLGDHIVATETSDKMTTPQVTAKVREYFRQ